MEYILATSNMILLISVGILLSSGGNVASRASVAISEEREEVKIPDCLPPGDRAKPSGSPLKPSSEAKGPAREMAICTKIVYNARVPDHTRKISRDGRIVREFFPGRKIRARSYKVDREHGMVVFEEESGETTAVAEEMVHDFDRNGFPVEYECEKEPSE